MLTSQEQAQIKHIEGTYYMVPILKRLEEKRRHVGTAETLDYIYEILTSSKDDVEAMLDERLRRKEISDKSQARKSIAGSAFSNMLQYIFLKCKEEGLVRKDIFITSKTKDAAFVNMVTIHVDGETQKPDMDIIIYSKNESNELKRCMIISLKTSLRERAGQTYKWKLLLEIATGSSEIKKKYNIRYDASKMPLVCFATVNFYNEINNPQHKGMFKFFDNSFIGKPIKADFISNLSSIVEYANSKL